MELSVEAKELIHDEFEELSKKIDQSLQELRLYRSALRVVFVLLFGGTIVGVFKLQDYLDERISNRNEELSGIIYGSLAHSSGDPRSAVDQYYSFLEKLDSASFRPSEAVRSIYYNRFIQALADANQTEPNGEFEVKSAFTALTEAKFFKKDALMNKERWRSDQALLNAWARCLLKFGSSTKEVESAKEFFERAASAATRPSDVASNHLGVAMLFLAKGDDERAKGYLERSTSESPRTHGLSLYSGRLESDFEGEVEMWRRASQLLGNPDIDKQYEVLIGKLKANDPSKADGKKGAK